MRMQPDDTAAPIVSGSFEPSLPTPNVQRLLLGPSLPSRNTKMTPLLLLHWVESGRFTSCFHDAISSPVSSAWQLQAAPRPRRPYPLWRLQTLRRCPMSLRCPQPNSP